MKSSFDLEKALRILKSKGIAKGEVAKRLKITPGYLSKMISGEKPVTQSVVDVLLKEYKDSLAGEELVEFLESDIIERQISLKATVDTHSTIIIGLISEVAEIKKRLPITELRELIKRNAPDLEKAFDEIVEGAAELELRKRARQ